MDITSLLLAVLAGVCLGAGLIYLVLVRPRGQSLHTLQTELHAVKAEHAVAQERAAQTVSAAAKLEERETELAALKEQLAVAQTIHAKDQEAAAERMRLVAETEKRLSDAFKALSGDALRANNDTFLQLAKERLGGLQNDAKADLEKRQNAITDLLKPMRSSLEKVDTKLQDLEKNRVETQATITQQVKSLIDVQNGLRAETANLAKALRSPVSRGQWGQIQLRRVVEMAGMVNYCDFVEEVVTESDAGRLRPDMIVRLPGNKSIVVDAKAVMAAYFESIQTDDEAERLRLLGDHARQVRSRIKDLGAKAYWQQFQPAPEFVVLFLPGEMLFSAALEQDPALIEEGVNSQVILATPTTLIGLLKAVAFGWRQEQMAENAREISALGEELHKRLADLGGHFAKLGGALDRAVGSYNQAVGSLESRVMVSARRFEDMGASRSGVSLEPPKPVEKVTRAIQAPDIAGEPGTGVLPSLDAAGDDA